MQPEQHDRHLGEAFEVALFRALTQSLEGYVSCVDSQRRVLFLNRTLDRDPAQVVGQPLEAFVPEAQRAETIACVERAFASSQRQRLEQKSQQNGAPRFLCTLVAPFLGPNGEQFALLVTEDVTERRLLATQLEESLAFQRRVIGHLPDFVALVDRARHIIWVNRCSTEQDQALLGRRVDELLTSESGKRARAAIEAAFQSNALGQYEAESTNQDSGTAWHQVRVVPIKRGEAVEHALLIASDITERKRAERALRETEEQLHRAQRLESLGQLSGGIAHDFNNLLQVIDGNLTFAQERLRKGQSVSEELEQALRATERASELTAHLLAIGRRQRVDPKRLELGALVAESIRMLRRAIPENVRLEFKPPLAPAFVELDAPQFEQVLINLCVNARDAMPAGGTLSVTIEDEGDTHVAVRVHDTGTGISRENLQRVFEPFFTTKGAGSGLGLAVASGIVAAHGGVIVAESDGKTGTTMTLRLPRVEANTENTAASTVGDERGGGVILLAEDEAMVRAQLVRVLTHAGYEVLEAENGARAVELFSIHKDQIDAVLLDMVMPELDGWQAFLRIEAMRPGIPVLFSTGYAASVLPKDFAARGTRLLSKPYKPQVLLSQIRELLADRARVHEARA